MCQWRNVTKPCTRENLEKSLDLKRGPQWWWVVGGFSRSIVRRPCVDTFFSLIDFPGNQRVHVIPEDAEACIRIKTQPHTESLTVDASLYQRTTSNGSTNCKICHFPCRRIYPPIYIFTGLPIRPGDLWVQFLLKPERSDKLLWASHHTCASLHPEVIALINPFQY